MALTLDTLNITRETTNATPTFDSPTMHFYKNDIDLQTTIVAAGYFNPVASSLIVGDLIYIRPAAPGSPIFTVVDTVTPDVTLTIFV